MKHQNFGTAKASHTKTAFSMHQKLKTPRHRMLLDGSSNTFSRQLNFHHLGLSNLSDANENIMTNKNLKRQKNLKQTNNNCLGVKSIAEQHDTFLLDMWGVMHDGSRPYDGVLDTIKKMKECGKRMIILSNSSKRQTESIAMLAKLGFDPDNFDQIITSGEVSVLSFLLICSNTTMIF